MRTYSKRQRLNPKREHDIALDTDIDNHAGRKRLSVPDTDDRSSKRQKSVQSTMDITSLSYETPHPTKQARDQAYKLPSTKPIPSASPFSPVPMTSQDKTLGKRASQRPVRWTASKNLKENDRYDIQSPRHSSKTLSSFTLTSGPGPLSHSKGSNKNRSHLPYLKTRNQKNSNSSPTSPQGSSRERSKNRSNATNGDGESLKKPTLFSKTAKSNFQRSSLIPTEHTLLASPFASRASSPVAFASHNMAGRKIGRDAETRSGLSALTEAHLDMNVLPQSNQGSNHVNKERNVQCASAHNSPKKPSWENCSSRESSNDNHSRKDRRSSAPSNLQRPLKPFGKAHVPSRMADHTKDQDVDVPRQQRPKKRLSVSESETNTRPVPLRREGSPTQLLENLQVLDDDFKFDLFDNHDAMSWMLARSAIDFNRPPSQMSMSFGVDTHGEGVFLSSDDECEDTNKRVGLNQSKEGFGGAWVTSTPFKEVLIRKRRFTMSNFVSDVLHVEHEDVVDENHDFAGDNSHNAENVELTVPLDIGDDINGHDLQDHTPWITDSIISPPTEYLQKEGMAADSTMTGRHDRSGDKDKSKPIVPTPIKARTMNPISRLSNPGSPYFASENAGSPDLAIRIVLVDENEEGDRSGELGVIPHLAIAREPRRTRSGTILAAQSVNSMLPRRTRTGTIVGLSSGRARSGTITPNSNGLLCLSGASRTRSGTIIGPRPGSGGRQNLSIKNADADTQNPEAPDEVGLNPKQRDSAGIDNRLTWALEDVEEVECHIDSLYVPRLASSPDPIDFLRFGHVKEAMDSNPIHDGPANELQWFVADEPLSPEVPKTKSTLTSVGGKTGKGIQVTRAWPNRRIKTKGKGKRLMRFMTTNGQVENLVQEDETSSRFEEAWTDDELLLVEGQSSLLFS